MRSVLVIVAAVALSAVAAEAQEFDSNAYYRLTTQFRGPDMALDVYNGGAKNNMTHLAPAQDVSGQYWNLRPTGDDYYRLTTMFRGRKMCLDVVNGGTRNNQLQIARCANYSGQFWRITPINGGYHLTTQFRGPDMCLDIYNGGRDNNEPHLTDCADFSGQIWSLQDTDKTVGPSRGGY
ncbi:MAG: RICIN domain-containing protein [Alphaproteobacteria bacterium]|nr:RICIN domain-containing protein [Alphaproteobacteria bacterium]MBV9419481.1 RICIN domain-containing protein [Alphaproteobacteria bacterium]